MAVSLLVSVSSSLTTEIWPQRNLTCSWTLCHSFLIWPNPHFQHNRRDPQPNRACGDVVGVIPDIDLFSGALTGVVIVEFAHKICAIQALRMEGSLLLSCPVRVSLKTALMAQIRSSQQQGLSFGAASMAMPGVPSQQNGVRQQAQGGRAPAAFGGAQRQSVWTLR